MWTRPSDIWLSGLLLPRDPSPVLTQHPLTPPHRSIPEDPRPSPGQVQRRLWAGMCALFGLGLSCRAKGSVWKGQVTRDSGTLGDGHPKHAATALVRPAPKFTPTQPRAFCPSPGRIGAAPPSQLSTGSHFNVPPGRESLFPAVLVPAEHSGGRRCCGSWGPAGRLPPGRGPRSAPPPGRQPAGRHRGEAE